MPTLSPFFVNYLACWISFCILALCIVVIERKRLVLELPVYLKFLCIPWKLWIFVPAFLFVSFAGPYTNDETWDFVTGSGMSILTFATAPWAVGVIYQVAIGKRSLRHLVVAIALLLFSSSWFYDGYLLWRDHAYTQRWTGNLVLSPIIYIAAGLLWNLEAKAQMNFNDRFDWRFSFVRSDWPTRPTNTQFTPLIKPMIPLIFIAMFVLVAFVRWRLGN
ncbi:hypothetical protein [Undibacterium sp.]|uniref:hypothetical protein n=1 Tax=Undibacterium sp. TaxID=1914977 RepID=UPI0037531D9D